MAPRTFVVLYRGDADAYDPIGVTFHPGAVSAVAARLLQEYPPDVDPVKAPLRGGRLQAVRAALSLAGEEGRTNV